MRSADSRAEAPTGEPHGDLERRLAAHAPALRAAAAGLCRRGATAELEDLIQDTFERALRHLSAGRPAPVNSAIVSLIRQREAGVEHLWEPAKLRAHVLEGHKAAPIFGY